MYTVVVQPEYCVRRCEIEKTNTSSFDGINNQLLAVWGSGISLTVAFMSLLMFYSKYCMERT